MMNRTPPIGNVCITGFLLVGTAGEWKAEELNSYISHFSFLMYIKTSNNLPLFYYTQQLLPLYICVYVYMYVYMLAVQLHTFIL